MKRWLLLFAVAVACGCPSMDSTPTPASEPQAPRPRYNCLRAVSEIAIDGQIDEAAWQDAEWASIENIVGDRGDGFENTEFAFLWDDIHLYFAARVEDSHIVADRKERDSPVWRDDCVEFFLDPRNTQTSYYELDFNSRGVFWDSIVLFEPDLNRYTSDGAWNSPSLTARSARAAGGWQIEGRIRFQDLPAAYRIPPHDGDSWGANAYRMNYLPTGRKGVASAWSPTESGFHSPRDFGVLMFRHPERTRRLAVLEESAAAFLASGGDDRGAPLTDRLRTLRVTDARGSEFVFEEDRRGWVRKRGGPYLLLSDEPEVPGELLVRNDADPLEVRWQADRVCRVVALARLTRGALEAANLGRADGTIVSLSAGEGTPPASMRVTGEPGTDPTPTPPGRVPPTPWRMLEIEAEEGEEIVLSVGPGPAGHEGLDRTRLAVFALDAVPRE